MTEVPFRNTDGDSITTGHVGNGHPNGLPLAVVHQELVFFNSLASRPIGNAVA